MFAISLFTKPITALLLTADVSIGEIVIGLYLIFVCIALFDLARRDFEHPCLKVFWLLYLAFPILGLIMYFYSASKMKN